jgi:hypothetical protein
MVDIWVFWVAAVLIVIAEFEYALVLVQQYRQLRKKTRLQSLKWLLIGSIFSLMVGALPLLVVYLDIVWWKVQIGWLIPVAVLTNAGSKVIASTVFNIMYKYADKNE